MLARRWKNRGIWDNLKTHHLYPIFCILPCVLLPHKLLPCADTVTTGIKPPTLVLKASISNAHHSLVNVHRPYITSAHSISSAQSLITFMHYSDQPLVTFLNYHCWLSVHLHALLVTTLWSPLGITTDHFLSWPSCNTSVCSLVSSMHHACSLATFMHYQCWLSVHFHAYCLPLSGYLYALLSDLSLVIFMVYQWHALRTSLCITTTYSVVPFPYT